MRGRRADLDQFLYQVVRHTVDISIESHAIVDVDAGARLLAQIERLPRQRLQGGLVESFPSAFVVAWRYCSRHRSRSARLSVQHPSQSPGLRKNCTLSCCSLASCSGKAQVVTTATCRWDSSRRPLLFNTQHFKQYPTLSLVLVLSWRFSGPALSSS